MKVHFAAAAFALSLCASAPAYAQSALDVLSGAAAAPGERAIDGEWSGRYVCGQGVTAVRIIVKNAGARSMFHFFSTPDNPGVPEGCLLMSGTYNSSSGTYTARVGDWIIRPRNFSAVGMKGQVDGAGENFNGQITGVRGCGKIVLTREVAPQPVPSACAAAIQ